MLAPVDRGAYVLGEVGFGSIETMKSGNDLYQAA
jgi:hypothetical protein